MVQMESVSLQTFDSVRIISTHRVRAWGRGHANRILTMIGVNPGEGHNKSLELTEEGIQCVIFQKAMF